MADLPNHREMTNMVLRLPADLKLRLRAASQRTGASQQMLVRCAIMRYLDLDLEALQPIPERVSEQ
jgi:predicted DNA-binding protein